MYLVIASFPCKLSRYNSLFLLSSTSPLGLLASGLRPTLHKNFPSFVNRQSLWFLLSATMMLPTLSTTKPAGSEN